MESRYINPGAILDIVDQSYFADIEVDAVMCSIESTGYMSLTGRIRASLPYDAITLRLSFPDDVSLMAFELSFGGLFTVDPPTAFSDGNIIPTQPSNQRSALKIIGDHIAELQAEARRAKINTTEEELSAHLGRHEGDE